MMKGVLRKDNRPVVPLVVGWDRGIQEIVALVDTGFNGELKMPPKMVDELGLRITHVQPVLLANDSIAQSAASLAFVNLEGITEEVNVLIAEGLAAIGVGLLKRFGYKLIVDFKYNSVVLERE